MNKTFKRGIAAILIMIVLIILMRTNNSVEKVVKEQRPTVIKSYNIYEIKEINKDMIVYSSGVVNKEQDNMYFIDVLNKNFLGYEWLDSRGHINRDIVKGKSFDLSMQLLKNDAMDGSIVFGIVKNPNIRKITVGSQEERHQTSIIKFSDQLESIYSVSFEKKLIKGPLTLTINYLDPQDQKTIIIDQQQLEVLEEGKQIYLRL